MIPQSISLRLAVVLCVLLGLNAALFVHAYLSNMINTVAPQTARSIGASVQAVRMALALMPPEQQQAWLSQISAGTAIKIEKHSVDAVSTEVKKRFFRRLESELRTCCGDDIRVDMRVNGERTLSVYFTAGGEMYRMSLPGTGQDVQMLWPLAWWIVSTAVIACLSVLFATWQINRPLQKGARILSLNSAQLPELNIPSSAPLEIRQFVETFNHLSRKYSAQEREQQLILAGVSHDLRAPLTRLRMRAELIPDSQSSDRLIQDAESMRRIIDQFLDYQRSIALSEVISVDLKVIAQSVVSRYRSLGKQVELYGTSTPPTPIDSVAMERIISNLIDNGLEHGAEPVEIDINHGSDYLRLEVRDHGNGIAEADMERALRPFERLDTARRAQGHCGLGLSIVQRLVERLNGKINIRNHPHGGLVVEMHFFLKTQTTSS